MQRLLSVLVVALVSCSGGKVKPSDEVMPEEQPHKSTTEEPVKDQGEGIPWEQKTHEQQKAYMGMTVKPRMEKLFTEFDAERFKEVKCSTCHGANARERDFEMPNPDLPKLEDWEKLKAEEPEMMEFMMEKVVPEMASLLGQQPFDPETKTGFGCSGCHPR